MLKKVHIANKVYEIDCNIGTQDVCWLAMSACYNYGMESYPVSRYLPCMAKNKEGVVLHPKMVIYKYNNIIGSEIFVNIKSKANELNSGNLPPEEDLWYRQAFTEERYMMNVKCKLNVQPDLKKEKFKILFKYEMIPEIPPNVKNPGNQIILIIQENENKTDNNLMNMKLPLGSLIMQKLIYFDKEGGEKEADMKKNSVSLEIFPSPLLPEEKEKMIIDKEYVIKNKEINLKATIKQIEKDKLDEEIRVKELREFLESLPFSFDEIFEYTNKEIHDATKDLIKIFAYLEKNEYLIFKKLSEIFKDYCNFYESPDSQVLDVESLMHFYKYFIDHSKPEMSNVIVDFQKFYLMRIENMLEYNFLEFVFSIIYVLYNTQIDRNIHIETEFYFINTQHEKKMQDLSFRYLFKNKTVRTAIAENISFLKFLFTRLSVKKMESYHEMSANQFLMFSGKLVEKGYKFIDNMALKKMINEDLCFFGFLEMLLVLCINENNNITGNFQIEANENEVAQRIKVMIRDIKDIWKDYMV
jgi:hypothetical protein